MLLKQIAAASMVMRLNAISSCSATFEDSSIASSVTAKVLVGSIHSDYVRSILSILTRYF